MDDLKISGNTFKFNDRNTPAFGKFLASFRGSLQLSYEEVGAAGGPSRGTLAPIEKGDPVVVSDDTIVKLMHAYGKLAQPDQPLNSSLVWAGVVNWRHHVSDDPDRILQLRKSANSDESAGRLFLGLRVDNDAPVYADGVALIQHDSIAYKPESLTQFSEYISAMAARHRGPVLIPVEHADEVSLDSRDDWQRSKPQSARRIVGFNGNNGRRDDLVALDPIAGVTDLVSAGRRAEALGVPSGDVLEVALILLAANYANVNAPISNLKTGQEGSGALYEAFRRLGRPLDKGRLENLVRQHLDSWRNEYIMATWDVVIDSIEGLKYNRIHLPSAKDDRNQSLWVYDPARLPRLPHVLAAQQAPALVFTPGNARVFSSGFSAPVYSWMPAGGSRCLLRDTDNRWIVVDMPDSYVRRAGSTEPTSMSK